MKVKKIVFATGNPNKLNEIKSAINGFEIVGLKDLGITEEIPETGNTLKKNALQKAKYVYDKKILVTIWQTRQNQQEYC